MQYYKSRQFYQFSRSKLEIDWYAYQLTKQISLIIIIIISNAAKLCLFMCINNKIINKIYKQSNLSFRKFSVICFATFCICKWNFWFDYAKNWSKRLGCRFIYGRFVFLIKKLFVFYGFQCVLYQMSFFFRIEFV